VRCNESIPTSTGVTASRACEGDLTSLIKFNTQRTASTCGSYLITNTWTVADHCGRLATATQQITVVNTCAPSFGQLPANLTVQCDSVPAAVQVSGSSVCGVVNVSTRPACPALATTSTICCVPTL
jgi:hypothetical protein